MGVSSSSGQGSSSGSGSSQSLCSSSSYQQNDGHEEIQKIINVKRSVKIIGKIKVTFPKWYHQALLIITSKSKYIIEYTNESSINKFEINMQNIVNCDDGSLKSFSNEQDYWKVMPEIEIINIKKNSTLSVDYIYNQMTLISGRQSYDRTSWNCQIVAKITTDTIRSQNKY